MPIALMVPVHLDALHVVDPVPVVGPTLCYERLPHHRDGLEQNADMPYLAWAHERWATRHRGPQLDPGVHLHWSMPDALTRLGPHGEPPPLPNRWLVQRSGGGLDGHTWVIESDAVRFGDRPHGPCAAIPWTDGPPFAWLGLTRTLGAELDASAAGVGTPASVARLAPFDAMVGNDVTFAPIYARSAGVFGVHDPTIGTQVPAGLRYAVYGYYTDPAEDIITTLDVRRTTQPRALEAQLGWTPDIDTVERTVCYACLDFPDGTPESGPIAASVDMAIGNTAQAALAALLTQDPAVERALAAMRYLADHGRVDTDLEHGLAEFRHDEGFHTVRGGTRWVLRRVPLPEGVSAPPEEPGLASALSQLVEAQRRYDTAWVQIEDLRDQLFTGWWRYLRCAYPHEGARLTDLPDIDEVRVYVEQQIVEPLEQLLSETGRLEWVASRRDTQLEPTMAPNAAGAHAMAVFERWSQARRLIPRVDGRALYDLVLAPGPRYFQPAEPVLALHGALVQPSVRHGADGRYHDDGHLVCASNWVEGPHDSVSDAERIFGWIHARFDVWRPSEGDSIAFSRVRTRPWHPLAVAWDATFEALAHERARAGHGPYPEEFITSHFASDPHLPELVHRGSPHDRAGPLPISGWTLLTRAGPGVLIDAIQRYLDEIDMHSPEPVAVLDALRAVRAELDAGLPLLSFALSGLHDALLMRRRSPQLPVRDPLALPGSDYATFAARVARLVLRPGTAPDPSLELHPLRAGMLRLHHMRLVGSFGELRTVEVAVPRLAETMSAGTDTHHAFLPPRLLRAARLRVRWTEASRPMVEATDHPASSPVHGWLVPSPIDERVLVFDSAGQRLGAIEVDDTEVQWAQHRAAEPDRTLAIVVATLLDGDANGLRAFMAAMAEAAELIDPADANQHRSLALLVSRPIAVVHAQLQLELAGTPPRSQGWEAFREMLAGQGHDEAGLGAVRFPVRLGAPPPVATRPARLDDGLLGFWVEGDGVLRAPKSTTRHPRIAPHDDPDRPSEVLVTADGARVGVTMLVDPRGQVHCSSGILPTKRLGLDPAYVTPALDAMEISFRAGPILSRPGHVDHLNPSDPDLSWTWVDDETAPIPQLIEELHTQAPLPQVLEVRDGFLRLARRADPR